MKRMIVILLVGLGCASGCKKTTPGGSGASGDEASHPTSDIHTELCPSVGANMEGEEADTNGDLRTDVVRVFKVYGEGDSRRRIIACREADLNGDGRRDAVRRYSDEGRPLVEQFDRDFDGRPDEWDYFEDAKIVQVEVDSDHDGNLDKRVFYENGKITRIEQDTTNRSTHDAFHANRWEYYEDGRLSRIGIDEDGDGRVDRWDRDEIMAEARRQAEAAAQAAAAAEAAAADAEE